MWLFWYCLRLCIYFMSGKCSLIPKTCPPLHVLVIRFGILSIICILQRFFDLEISNYQMWVSDYINHSFTIKCTCRALGYTSYCWISIFQMYEPLFENACSSNIFCSSHQGCCRDFIKLVNFRCGGGGGRFSKNFWTLIRLHIQILCNVKYKIIKFINTLLAIMITLIIASVRTHFGTYDGPFL